MKFYNIIFFLTFLISFELFAQKDNMITYEHGSHYKILLATLESDLVRIFLLDIHQHGDKSTRDIHATDAIFSLNLSDYTHVYNSITCDQSTGFAVTIRSSNEALYDYYLSWGPLCGINTNECNFVDGITATIKKDNQTCTLHLAGILENVSVDMHLNNNNEIFSACACAITCDSIQCFARQPETMTLDNACRLGIVHTIEHKKPLNFEKNREDSLEKELEFERIIDSMARDGAITIKDESPLMTRIKTICSALFMKYLAVQNFCSSSWNKLIGSCYGH